MIIPRPASQYRDLIYTLASYSTSFAIVIVGDNDNNRTTGRTNGRVSPPPFRPGTGNVPKTFVQFPIKFFHRPRRIIPICMLANSRPLPVQILFRTTTKYFSLSSDRPTRDKTRVTQGQKKTGQIYQKHGG